MSKYPIEFKRPPTPQQEAIYDHLLNTKESLVVQATAGAGKTTTLVSACEILKASGVDLGGIVFVAFNKAIVDELKAKLPHGIEAATMHSVGYRMLREGIGAKKVESYKYDSLVDDWLKGEGIKDYHERRSLKSFAKDLLNALRLNLVEEASQLDLGDMLTEVAPEHPAERAPLIIACAKDSLEAGIRRAEYIGEVDFTDMLYLPWKLELEPSKRYHTVLLDEAQDQSPLQRWIALRIMASDGRMVAVGDRNQAIYGFAGAAPEGMDELANILSAKRLPLSVTWRCPVSHVVLAQAIVGKESIQAASNAAQGEAKVIGMNEFMEAAEPGDLVLGRTNQPLVTQAFALLRAKKRVKIRGRDIGEGLIRVLKAVEGQYLRGSFSIAALLSGINEYANDKINKLYQRTDLNENELGIRVAQIDDQRATLAIIAEESGAEDMEGVRKAIDDLFANELGDFILLSTVHKAKGLEFDNVYILRPDLMPAYFGAVEEEKCVTFVALTRAKKGLYFIEGLPDYVKLEAAMSQLRNEGAA